LFTCTQRDGNYPIYNTSKSLDKEKEDEEYGTERNLEMTDILTKEEVRAAVDKL
jgi:hypothetical protein